MRNPLAELIAAKVETQKRIEVPVPKYTLVVEITANSREELADRVRGMEVNWGYRFSGRDQIDSTDGTTSVFLEHTNPEQTPEAYMDALEVWRVNRRAARVSPEGTA